MGMNLNFVDMAGAPTSCLCPKCGLSQGLGFDDLDADVTNDETGRPDFRCGVVCDDCGHEFEVKLRLYSKIEILKAEGET